MRPRQRKVKHYNVVAIRHQDTLNEQGVIGSVTELVENLESYPPTAFVRMGVADFVADLDSHFDTDPNWQWRASSDERDIYLPGKTRLASRVTTVVHYFGWRSKGGAQGNYHLALDPVTFYGKDLDEIWPGNEPVITRLLQWATTLRNWCNENQLLVKPTNGGMGAQLLRDRRFYPDNRRKVPSAINTRSRNALPGNYYRLYTGVRPSGSTPELQAIYLDQRRAHHYHAEHISLPDSNTLFAYGRFLDLGDTCFDRAWSDFYGLYYLHLLPPEKPSDYSPFARATEGSPRFVWSNELPYLTDIGYRVGGVIAAWGSKNRDHGIQRYSRWAQRQLDASGSPAWLKPILLSTYGVLAAKQRPMNFVYKSCRSTTPATLRTGHSELHGLLTAAARGRKLEPGITNVLHRGMIEAATRAESLGYAQYLEWKGYRVLAIYADAVIVRDEGNDLPSPPLIEPWSVKTPLTHLQFISKQAFISGEMTRLPGITGAERRRLSPASHKTAPKRVLYDVLSGEPVKTTRRI